MSFIDDVISAGKGLLGGTTGNILSSIAKTAVTGFILNQISTSIKRDNQKSNASSASISRIQVEANPENTIPVVYGSAWLGGIITDARLTNGNGTMYYCLTLCEKTGNTGLGSGPASTFTFGDIYRDDMKLIFAPDGITVVSQVDREGNVCNKVNGKIKVWCYAGSSTTPVVPQAYTNNSPPNANAVMPGWGVNHSMSNLVFAIVRIDYDATNEIRSLGTFKFQIKNSMTQPGDCIYDYMTNTVYGAGIAPGSILL